MRKMSKEIWKDIPGYERLYKISSNGQVFSHISNKILKLCDNGNGYLYLRLCKKSEKRLYYAHQLIGMAFLEHKVCGRAIVIDHIDNNPSNNKLENLRILTHRENISRRRDGASKYTGVTFHAKTGKWRAAITINKIRYSLGLFFTEIEAHKAYQNELLKL